MSTTASQMREWTGPAVLSFGFRPFFLLAGVWAALAMAQWIAMLSGWMHLPTAFDPVAWHAHEFLFGYLGAVAAGFLLTAVPNWTGRLPVVGWPLAWLAGLWGVGRVAVLVSATLSPMLVALADLAFLTALCALLLREIVAGCNWRNLPVVGLLAVLVLANALFHWEAAVGFGFRLGLAVAVLMITVIGGRVVPSFTRNWLVRNGKSARPVPFAGFDRTLLPVTATGLAIWVAAPQSPVAGAVLIGLGLLHSARLSRWAGHHTLAEPLVWILHVGYAFVPLGALAMGLAALRPDHALLVAAQHLWMAGAIGVMTAAMMTRAALGHSGRALHAGPGTLSIYALLIGSVVARLVAGVTGPVTIHLAGALWIAGFLAFAALYGPILLTRRKDA